MKTEIFTLCDSAEDKNGKLSIHGTFDTICMQGVKGMAAQCSVALRIRFTRIESGKHRVRLSMVDEDGRSILPIPEGEIELHIAPPDDSIALNLIFNLQKLQFPKFGKYSVDLAIDGKQEGALPFFVKPLAASS